MAIFYAEASQLLMIGSYISAIKLWTWWYCWWFKHPVHHLGCIKKPSKSWEQATHEKVSRISFINCASDDFDAFWKMLVVWLVKIKREFHHPALGIPTQIARKRYFVRWKSSMCEGIPSVSRVGWQCKKKSVMNKFRMPKSSSNGGRSFWGTVKNQLYGSTSPCQGDYMWTRGTEVLGVCIERKTMRDLIGRSAKGDHVRRRVKSGETLFQEIDGLMIREPWLSLNKTLWRLFFLGGWQWRGWAQWDFHEFTFQ